jgi:hypothetical protein
MADDEAADPAYEFTGRGWPRPWMGAFLDALSVMPVVSYAAQAAKIDRKQIYRHRDSNPAFAAALEEARLRGIELLEQHAHRWAIAGLKKSETTTVYDENGKVVSKRTVEGLDINPTLVMFLLKKHKPEYRDRVVHDGEVRIKLDEDSLDREISQLLSNYAPPDGVVGPAD